MTPTQSLIVRFAWGFFIAAAGLKRAIRAKKGRCRAGKELNMDISKMSTRKMFELPWRSLRFSAFFADDATGTQDAGAADQQTGDAGAAGGQQAATTPAAGENQNSQVDAFKAKALDETNKRQTAEAENATLKQQLAIAQANPVQGQSAGQQTLSVAAQIGDKLGFGTDVNYYTNEQMMSVNNAIFQAQAVQADQKAFISQHSDFADVVGTVNPATNQIIQLAPPIQRYLAKNPTMVQTLTASPQGMQMAYQLAINDPEYQKSLAEKTGDEQTDAKKAAVILEAANKQTSISAAAGAGGTMDHANAVRNMSDEEFAKYKQDLINKAL